MESIKEKKFKLVENVFTAYLNKKNHRKTPERYTILKEIYIFDRYFDVDTLHFHMLKKNYRVSRATIYNTIELLLDAELIIKHRFGDSKTTYERSFFDKQHDHVILKDTGEVIEFCDPRIQAIKETIEEVFEVEIESHSLYFYGKRKK